MTQGTGYPTSKSSPVDTPGRGARDRSSPRRFSLRWLTTLIVLANVVYAGLITTQALGGTIRHATAETGIYGSVLLVFALVPANLLRFGWFKKRKLVRFLAWLRKPLGISSGVWTHAGLIVAGTAAAVVIYATSWAMVGPWDFARERPPGPLPRVEQKGPPPDGV